MMLAVDRGDAGSAASAVLATLRCLPYEALVERFIVGGSEWAEQAGDGGQSYQVKLQGFWDGGRRGPIRVTACADDGSARWIVRPACDDFIKAPDGTFVGE
jgi:hypothetical protein